MSIKHVHILFIFFSALLNALLTTIFFANYRETSLGVWMVLGMLTLIAAVVLPVYGVAFYKKMKKLEVYR